MGDFLKQIWHAYKNDNKISKAMDNLRRKSQDSQ